MKKADKQFLTWLLRIVGTVTVVVIAYYVAQGFFHSALDNNVSPNIAYGGAIGIFAIVPAVWLSKLAVRVQIR